MKKLFFFSFLLTLSITSPLCPGPNSMDLIQTGVVDLQKPGVNQQDSCYKINIEYNVPDSGYQLGLSFSSLPQLGSSLNYVSLKGIKTEKKNSFGIVLVTTYKSWRQIKTSYLVSSRQDLVVGSFLLDPYTDFNCDTRYYDKNIKQYLPNLKKESKYDGQVFLSGFQISDTNILLKIQLIQVNSQQGSISLKIETDSNPLVSFLQITYILKTQSFPLTFSIPSETFMDDYTFSGLKDFEQKSKYITISINSQKLYCSGSKCEFQCITKVQCQLQNGTIEGKTCFICQQGFQVKNNKCVSICRSTQIYQNGRCIRPSCPTGSFWNQMILQCYCFEEDEHVINGSCQKCLTNQTWNHKQKQCQCMQGSYRLNGQCGICEINQYYNEQEQICQCNYGFFRNGEKKCESCHPTCGRCFGPQINQCIQCSDVSYSYQNGLCTRENLCPKGLFLSQKQCVPCSAYCQSCSGQLRCDKCIQGFQIDQIVFAGNRVSYCVQLCGDGKRFEVECDDGNSNNNDGCNKDCQVQKGWTCLGGSTIKPSQCTLQRPDKTEIKLTGTVHLLGRIVQGIRLSYLPPQVTLNDCANCNKLLWIRVINSPVIPGVRINYMPKSKYQFLAQFQFNGIFAVPIFTISVQINPDFSKYFTQADLAQIQIKTIDPSTLKIEFLDQALSLDDIQETNQIQGAQQINRLLG